MKSTRPPGLFSNQRLFMAVNPDNIDLTHIDDVTDIKPHPTLAISDHRRYFGHLGDEGKILLKELLDETPDDEDAGTRVFDRLGVPYAHASWQDFDLYWAEEGDQAMVEALEAWNAARSMS